MTPEFCSNHLPQDAVENYPYFANFMEKYYDWNVTNGFGKVIDNYKELIYQNLASTEYETLMLKSIGLDVNLTEKTSLHNEILYKLANEFLESRGTQVSVQLLFKMLFMKSVEVKYPRDNLLVPSHATYQRCNVVLINGHYPLSIYSSLKGLRSGTETGIESFIPYYINGSRYYLVECMNLHEQFTIGEPIKVETIDGISYTVVLQPLIDLNILDGGVLYKKNDKIIPDNNLFDGYFQVKQVSKGSVDGINIIQAGENYLVGERIESKDGNHFYGEILEINNNGGIKKVKVIHGGYNLKDLPTYQINTKSGTGASLQLTTKTIGKVKKVSPCNGGYILSLSNVNYKTESKNGQGLIIKSKAVSYIRRERYINNYGFLGYRCDTLNSYTKHSHSYDLISNVPASKYTDVVSKYTNPTGYVYNTKFKNTLSHNINKIGLIHNEIIRK